LSCVALTATAQTNTTKSLSLRDCIELALRNNLDLQIERYNTDIAEYGVQGAYGVYDPTLAFEATHKYDDMPRYLVADKANPDFPYKADSEVLGTGIKGKLPGSGLAYELGARAVDFHNVRTDFNLTPEDNLFFFGPFGGSSGTAGGFPFTAGVRHARYYYGEAGLSLRQPLLKNAWIDVERQQIKINKNNLHMSEEALRGAIMRTVTLVQLAYYDLIYARENVKVQNQAIELANQLLTETRARLRAGELTPLDEQQAQVHLTTVQSDLFAAEQAFLEQQNVVKQYIAGEFSSWRDMDIFPTENLLAVLEKPNRIQSWENGLTRRSDVLQLKLELERQNIILKYDYSQLFPVLDLVGSIGVRSGDRDLGTAAGDIGDTRHPFYSFGAIFSIPLGNRAARNAHKASQAAYKQALTRMKRLENNVLMQVDTAIKVMESSYKRVSSTKNARQYAEKVLQARQKELEQGVKTNLGLLEAQTAITTARSAEIRALADYNKARAQFTFNEGMTMEKYNLRLDLK